MNKKYYLLWLNDNNCPHIVNNENVDCYFENIFEEDYPGNSIYTIPKCGAIIGYVAGYTGEGQNKKEIICEYFTRMIIDSIDEENGKSLLKYYNKTELIPSITENRLDSWVNEEVINKYIETILSIIESKMQKRQALKTKKLVNKGQF